MSFGRPPGFAGILTVIGGTAEMRTALADRCLLLLKHVCEQAPRFGGGRQCNASNRDADRLQKVIAIARRFTACKPPDFTRYRRALLDAPPDPSATPD